MLLLAKHHNGVDRHQSVVLLGENIRPLTQKWTNTKPHSIVEIELGFQLVWISFTGMGIIPLIRSNSEDRKSIKTKLTLALQLLNLKHTIVIIKYIFVDISHLSPKVLNNVFQLFLPKQNSLENP